MLVFQSVLDDKTKELSTREPVTGYRHITVLCSHFEYLICDWVYSYSM